MFTIRARLCSNEAANSAGVLVRAEKCTEYVLREALPSGPN
jgi:hypothetical protein